MGRASKRGRLSAMEERVLAHRWKNHSNPNLAPVRGDTVPDSMCNLKLATQEDAEAAWRGCQAAIRKWLGMHPLPRQGAD